MRTTVTLDDALLVEVKTYAAQNGRTMNDVIIEAVRAAMARRHEPRPPVDLPVFHGGHLQAGVDLDDNAALLDLMEEPGG